MPSKIANTEKSIEFIIYDEVQTAKLAQTLAKNLHPPLWVELIGDLGVGKTTITRYVLNALGHKGHVKSPTYTLIEPYDLETFNFYHFDLYRLADPEELEYLGFRDYLAENCIGFVEWPSKGLGYLPQMDLSIQMEFSKTARLITIKAHTTKGLSILNDLSTNR